MRSQKDSLFEALVLSDEKEWCAQGLGILDASGIEAGGRVDRISESSGKLEVVFSYYATKSQNGLSLKIGEPLLFDKQGTLRVHRVNITCLVIEENQNSFLVLFPDPKKITAQIKEK